MTTKPPNTQTETPPVDETSAVLARTHSAARADAAAQLAALLAPLDRPMRAGLAAADTLEAFVAAHGATWRHRGALLEELSVAPTADRYLASQADRLRQLMLGTISLLETHCANAGHARRQAARVGALRLADFSTDPYEPSPLRTPRETFAAAEQSARELTPPAVWAEFEAHWQEYGTLVARLEVVAPPPVNPLDRVAEPIRVTPHQTRAVGSLSDEEA